MGKRILVIDDDADILDVITLILEDEGYVVTALRSGKQIADFINPLPDLIIMDVLLAGSDGRSICKQIKLQKDKKVIPVLMISAQPHIEKSVLDAGANAFLTKPFEIDIFIATVQKLLQKNNRAHIDSRQG